MHFCNENANAAAIAKHLAAQIASLQRQSASNMPIQSSMMRTGLMLQPAETALTIQPSM